MRREAFRHEALFYTGTDEFLEGVVPLLDAAIEAGEPTLVAVSRSRARELRGTLGAAADEVRFADMESLGLNPARVIPLWRDFVDQQGVGRSVLGVGEPIWPGRRGAEIEECRRHESLLNLVFEGAPSWRLLCPYDSGSLERDALDVGCCCHPFLAEDGDSEENPDWQDEAPGPFDGVLAARPADASTLDFNRATLHDVRSMVGHEAERRRLDGTRCNDLITATSELAANSILHGGGRGQLAIWEENDALLVEVEDAGWIEDPLAGRRRPDPTQVSGRGLWLVNALCDLVQVRSGPQGTMVRLQMEIA